MRKLFTLLFLTLIFFHISGCSLLQRYMESGQGFIETRQEKKQSRWEWEGFLTCGEPSFQVDQDGVRWCTLILAPIMADCISSESPVDNTSSGLEFWFKENTLSGRNNEFLYELCQDSEYGERWPHLDGVIQEGNLIVLDANRGSNPL